MKVKIILYPEISNEVDHSIKTCYDKAIKLFIIMFDLRRIKGFISYHFRILCNDVKNYFLLGTSDFFNDINIETITYCNRRCWYCPNSLVERGLKENKKFMDIKLFHKIIDELARLNFKGRISPHFYGEPLLDPRIVDLMRYVRNKLPKSSIKILTNGDFLTVDLFKNLISAGVNHFLITQHSLDKSPAIKQLFEYLKKNKNYFKYITYKEFIPPSDFSNRGGLIKGITNKKLKPKCRNSNNPVVITNNGDVILCCDDYLSSCIFGNLKNNSLLDIWQSEKFKLIRKQLRRKIYLLDICKKCQGIN